LKKLNIVFYLWLLVVLFLSVYNFSGVEAPKNSDKVVHYIIYFITALITYIYSLRFITDRKLLVFVSVIFASFYGLLMECIQYFLPYRSFSLGDEFANISGAVAFGIIILLSKNYITINGRKILK